MVDSISSMFVPGAGPAKPGGSKPNQEVVAKPSELDVAKEAAKEVARLERKQETESPETLIEAVEKIAEFIQIVRRNLEFTIDETTGRTVVTVVDSDTDEVIRQIPPEDVLNIARNLHDLRGILFRAKA